MALKRVLTFYDALFLGVGMIVGAGIYALIGLAAQQAGPALWISFLLAGALAFLIALNYAELSSLFPKAGSTYFYSKAAFENPALSFVAGWLIAIAATVGAATVSLGFGLYFSSFFPQIPVFAGAVMVLSLCAFANIRSLKAAATLNMGFTSIEVIGLILVIAIGFLFSQPSISFQAPHGVQGILSAMILAFFAYLGFEALATTAEELKNPRKNLPRAILGSVAISLVLYILVALSLFGLSSYEQINASMNAGVAPLIDAVSKHFAQAGVVIGFIALFATSNTVLISLISASRMIYSMATECALPHHLCKTNAAGTPQNAIILSASVAVLLASLGDISLVAEATVVAMLLVFALDAAAVIQMRLKKPSARREFKIPFNVKGIPVSAVIVILASVAIAAYALSTKPLLIQLMLGLLLAGLVAYFLQRR